MNVKPVTEYNSIRITRNFQMQFRDFIRNLNNLEFRVRENDFTALVLHWVQQKVAWFGEFYASCASYIPTMDLFSLQNFANVTVPQESLQTFFEER